MPRTNPKSCNRLFVIYLLEQGAFCCSSPEQQLCHAWAGQVTAQTQFAPACHSSTIPVCARMEPGRGTAFSSVMSQQSALHSRSQQLSRCVAAETQPRTKEREGKAKDKTAEVPLKELFARENVGNLQLSWSAGALQVAMSRLPWCLPTKLPVTHEQDIGKAPGLPLFFPNSPSWIHSEGTYLCPSSWR